MRKLDWYILKKFLVTFFFCLLLFTVIAVAVDSSEKTDDFVKAKLTTGQIISQYYLGFVPWIWSMLFPLFVFIAVIYFTSRMATRSEIIAILTSGTSYNRFLRPYFFGGLLLAGLLWLGGRSWVPRANILRTNFHAKYIDPNTQTGPAYKLGCTTCFYRRADSDTYVGFKDFHSDTKTAMGFFLEKIRNDKVIYNLRGSSITWNANQQKWRLSNAVERFVDSVGEREKRYDTFMLKLSIRPEELRNDEYLKDKLTTPQLTQFISREEQRGSEGLNTYKVELYRRTATAFSVLLLTLIGAVVASRKTRGGSGMHLALGITIAAFFVISDRFSTVFSTKGNFPPILAAWTPNIVFSFVAFLFYRKTPK
jgi:lipopolysaccharide export system permease protein